MGPKNMQNAITQNPFFNERLSPIPAEALNLMPRHCTSGQTRDSPTWCGSSVKPVRGVAPRPAPFSPWK